MLQLSPIEFSLLLFIAYCAGQGVCFAVMVFFMNREGSPRFERPKA